MAPSFGAREVLHTDASISNTRVPLAYADGVVAGDISGQVGTHKHSAVFWRKEIIKCLSAQEQSEKATDRGHKERTRRQKGKRYSYTMHHAPFHSPSIFLPPCSFLSFFFCSFIACCKVPGGAASALGSRAAPAAVASHPANMAAINLAPRWHLVGGERPPRCRLRYLQPCRCFSLFPWLLLFFFPPLSLFRSQLPSFFHLLDICACLKRKLQNCC